MKKEEQESKVTLYTFIYYFNTSEVYRQENEATCKMGDFFIRDKKYDDTIYVHGYNLNKPQIGKDGKDDSEFLYVYTLDDDVNKAMKLMDDCFKRSVETLKKNLNKIELMWGSFEAKQREIANKYPTGKKEEIESMKEMDR